MKTILVPKQLLSGILTSLILLTPVSAMETVEVGNVYSMEASADNAQSGSQPDPVAPEPVVIKNGLLKEKGKYYYYENNQKLTSQWKTIRTKNDKVQKMYFQKNGAACMTVLRLNGRVYIFNKKGFLRTGNGKKLYKIKKDYYCPGQDGSCLTDQWIQIKGRWYYALKNGKMAKNKTIDGIKIRNMRVEDTTSFDCQRICQQVLSQITSPNMSSYEKLQRCYDYLVGSSFSYALRYNANRSSRTWAKKKAIEMLQSHAGDCVSYACAFAGLAAAIGYRPVVYYGRVPGTRDQAADGFTTHCWVKIGGGFYDPEAHAAGWHLNIFNLASYPMAYQVTNTYDFVTGKCLS